MNESTGTASSTGESPSSINQNNNSNNNSTSFPSTNSPQKQQKSPKDCEESSSPKVAKKRVVEFFIDARNSQSRETFEFRDTNKEEKEEKTNNRRTRLFSSSTSASSHRFSNDLLKNELILALKRNQFKSNSHNSRFIGNNRHHSSSSNHTHHRFGHHIVVDKQHDDAFVKSFHSTIINELKRQRGTTTTTTTSNHRNNHQVNNQNEFAYRVRGRLSTVGEGFKDKFERNYRSFHSVDKCCTNTPTSNRIKRRGTLVAQQTTTTSTTSLGVESTNTYTPNDHYYHHQTQQQLRGVSFSPRRAELSHRLRSLTNALLHLRLSHSLSDINAKLKVLNAYLDAAKRDDENSDDDDDGSVSVSKSFRRIKSSGFIINQRDKNHHLVFNDRARRGLALLNNSESLKELLSSSTSTVALGRVTSPPNTNSLSALNYAYNNNNTRQQYNQNLFVVEKDVNDKHHIINKLKVYFFKLSLIS